MRVVASNPDGLGHLVLRGPLYEALMKAGHDLHLIVRPDLSAWIPLLVPGAREILLADGDAARLMQRVREVKPTLLLLAAYPWTDLEQQLVAGLPGVRVAGLFEKPGAAEPDGPPAWLDLCVSVEEDLPEVEKTRRLAEALLGPLPGGCEPRVTATQWQRDRAAGVLAGLGLAPERTWLACVGRGPRRARNPWPAEHWAAALRHGAARGLHFLLGDLHDDADDCRRILDMTGGAGAVLPAGMEPELWLGMLAVTGGYLGRDSGVMHLAAALGRPVVAVVARDRARSLPHTPASHTVAVDLSWRGYTWIDPQAASPSPGSPPGALVAALEEALSSSASPAPKAGPELLELLGQAGWHDGPWLLLGEAEPRWLEVARRVGLAVIPRTPTGEADLVGFVGRHISRQGAKLRGVVLAGLLEEAPDPIKVMAGCLNRLPGGAYLLASVPGVASRAEAADVRGPREYTEATLEALLWRAGGLSRVRTDPATGRLVVVAARGQCPAATCSGLRLGRCLWELHSRAAELAGELAEAESDRRARGEVIRTQERHINSMLERIPAETRAAREREQYIEWANEEIRLLREQLEWAMREITLWQERAA